MDVYFIIEIANPDHFEDPLLTQPVPLARLGESFLHVFLVLFQKEIPEIILSFSNELP